MAWNELDLIIDKDLHIILKKIIYSNFYKI